MFSKQFFISTFLIAFLYLLLATYIMNFTLILNTIIGQYPFFYKAKLLFVLLGGMWTAMTHTGLVILFVTSLLTGANLSLIGSRIIKMKTLKNVHYVASSGSLLGIISSGCAACGLPIISLLGLSGSIIYLPLRGMELSYLAVILLAISLYLLIRTNIKVKTCAIDTQSTSVIGTLPAVQKMDYK